MSEVYQRPNENNDIKIETIETGMEAINDDSRWSPKSPLPRVGAIEISDEESMEETENNDEWTNPTLAYSQIGSPPASPTYTSGYTEGIYRRRQ